MPLISQLPADILLSVAGFLPAVRDRTALGSACTALHRALEASLFSCVRCSSGTTDLDASMVAARYGHLVRRLRFECLMFENPSDGEGDGDGGSEGGRDKPLEKAPDAGGTPDGARSMELGTTVAATLRGELFPSVDTLVVVFHPHDEFRGDRWVDDEYKCGGSIYISLADEDLHVAAVAEEKFRWRRLMARVWREIAANTKIRSLEIVTLPPNITTAWADAAWPSFVGNLERLTIGLWAGDNGAGWQSNTTWGYLQFLEEHLATFFFDNARGLHSLAVIAHKDNPFGGSFYCNGTHSAFGKTNMPHLKELRVHNCGVDAELLEFLHSHADVLETLHLVECMATTFNVPNPLTWADFFNNMYRIPNSVLSDLVFNFKTAPLTHREEFEADYAPREDEDPRILQARQELCRDRNLKLFPYYYLDDKYGMTFADRELILQRFESGEDQLAYDRLVAKIKLHSP